MRNNFLNLFKSKSNQGATAVEFAFVFPIFLLIIFSIIEFGMIMFVRSVLDSAALEAARYGTTGSTYDQKDANGKPITREQLVIETITDKLSVLPFYDPKENPVEIEFHSLGKIDNLDMSGKLIKTAGAGDEVVEYSLHYNWKLLSPLMYPFLGTKGIYAIEAKTIIKNESF